MKTENDFNDFEEKFDPIAHLIDSFLAARYKGQKLDAGFNQSIGSLMKEALAIDPAADPKILFGFAFAEAYARWATTRRFRLVGDLAESEPEYADFVSSMAAEYDKIRSRLFKQTAMEVGWYFAGLNGVWYKTMWYRIPVLRRHLPKTRNYAQRLLGLRDQLQSKGPPSCVFCAASQME